MKKTKSPKLYSCPYCKKRKVTSPVIHGLASIKKYTKHGLKVHIKWKHANEIL